MFESVIATGRPGSPPDADEANERAIAARRDMPVPALIDELIATRARVRDLIGRLPTERLEVVVPLGDAPTRLGTALLDLSRHDREHAADLRRSLSGRES